MKQMIFWTIGLTLCGALALGALAFVAALAVAA